MDKPLELPYCSLCDKVWEDKKNLNEDLKWLGPWKRIMYDVVRLLSTSLFRVLTKRPSGQAICISQSCKCDQTNQASSDPSQQGGLICQFGLWIACN